MNQDQLKQQVAQAALDHILPTLKPDAVLGIGTGSTANCFIDALAQVKDRFYATVASSQASAARLQSHGIRVLELNEVGRLAVYVDGADESNRHLELIKGGGAALTREKIVAAASEQFICIADQSKLVDRLGAFPLPVEVIPMAREYVLSELSELGGRAVTRSGVITDNGNIIIDVHGLKITDACAMELRINQIVGVVTNGLFAQRPADLLLLGTPEGVKTLSVINTPAEDGEYY